MKSIFKLLIIIIITNNLFSQENLTKETLFNIGAFVGINLNNHNASFSKIEGFPNCCPQFSDGFGTGLSLGLFFNYPFSSKLNLETRFGIYNLNGELNKEQIIGNTEIRDPNPPYETTNIIDAISKYTINSKIQIIGIEPVLKYAVIDNLFVLTGIRFGFLNSATFDQSEILISPNNIVFKDSGTRSRNEYKNSDIPNTNGLQLHFLIGSSYHFNFKDFTLIPDIRYYFPLTNINKSEWKLNQLQFSISAQFPIKKSLEIKELKEEIFMRDTSVVAILGIKDEEVKLVSQKEEILKENIDATTVLNKHIITEKYERRIPKESSLSAFIIASGIRNDGTEEKNPTIIIEEIETYETFPLLNYVFFKNNDSDLKNTSQKLLSKNQIDFFEESKLPQNTFEIYNNLLNIIGYRLKNNNKATITLTGTNNNRDEERNNLKLSENRAQSAKDYLTNVWGIEPNRINIQFRNLPEKSANNNRAEGLEENRRVEITSDNIDILKPVTIFDIYKTSNPPIVKLTPQISSDVGIKKWEIKILQNNKIFRKFDDKNDVIFWKVEEFPIPLTEDVINIELNVEDVAGKKIKVEKNLELKQLTIKKKREELIDDKRIEKYALILFDYDRADLKPEHKEIIKNIKEKINNNSTVIISGYADATGELEYNKELSLRRINNVIKELNLNNIAIKTNNIGSDILLFDNSTPEGRSFCRTVTILIETPINGK